MAEDKLQKKILFTSEDIHTRPAEMEIYIKELYVKLTKEKVPYCVKGGAVYRYLFNGDEVDSTSIIKNQLQTGHDDEKAPLLILDLAPGKGNSLEFINGAFKGKALCYGIDARKSLTSDKCLQGNIETLKLSLKETILANKKFDLIMTRHLVKHLIDPALTLIDAFDLLAVNGILIMDNFTLPGCEGYLYSLIKYLQKQEHIVIADVDNKAINNLIIKKTKKDESLKLPISRNGMVQGENRGKYKVITSLLSPDDFTQVFQLGANYVAREISKFELNDLVNTQHTLENLISNEMYSALPSEQQYFAILSVAGKSLTQKNYADLEQTLLHAAQNEIVNPDILNLFDSLQDFNFIEKLFENSIFKNYPSRTVQLNVIKFIAFKTILGLGKYVSDGEFKIKLKLQWSGIRFFWEEKAHNKNIRLSLKGML